MRQKRLSGKNYTVTLQDVNQQVIAEQEVRTNKFGSFAGKFTLPKEVLNGMFIISTDGGSQMITVRNTNVRNSRSRLTR